MNPTVMETARDELTEDELARLRELVRIDREATALGIETV